MKIFVKVAPASKSVNFVDEKNRVLGWNASQICCENHMCNITTTEPVETFIDSVVDDEYDMNDEERERHANGETIIRPYPHLKVENVKFSMLQTLDSCTIDLPGWEIDPDYYKEIGSAVVFRLFHTDYCDNTTNMFVVLENYHNGYYSHGFHLEVGGINKVEGAI